MFITSLAAHLAAAPSIPTTGVVQDVSAAIPTEPADPRAALIAVLIMVAGVALLYAYFFSKQAIVSASSGAVKVCSAAKARRARVRMSRKVRLYGADGVDLAGLIARHTRSAASLELDQHLAGVVLLAHQPGPGDQQ